MPMELCIIYIRYIFFFYILFFSIWKDLMSENSYHCPVITQYRHITLNRLYFSIGILLPPIALLLTKEAKSLYRCSYQSNISQ